MAPDLRKLTETVAGRLIAHTEELTALDAAIGDADHGLNMKRGCEAVLAEIDALAAKPLPEALKAIGMTLVMKVGGASGPMYGTLFMTLGKELDRRTFGCRRRTGARRRRRCHEAARQGGARTEDHAGRAGADRRCAQGRHGEHDRHPREGAGRSRKRQFR